MSNPNIPPSHDNNVYDDEEHWAYEWDDAWEDVLDTLEFLPEEDEEN